MGIVRRSTADSHGELVRALLEPGAYLQAGRVEHLETHISHVFLTGAYAYKIKKPLNLGFLDFSSLDKRRAFCEEELRINRRLAPDLYLAVVPITGTAGAPRVEGDGAAIEYAVKMRQFAQSDLLEHVLERGELAPELIDALAGQVARFHASIPRADPASPFGSIESIVDPARQNFEQIEPLLSTQDSRLLAQSLRDWTQKQSEGLAAQFEQRRREGFVRECHGDLHLANMVLIGGEVRIFDAIEFNPALRWIDVINEVAFTAMDLSARGRSDLGARFVNAYLEHTGDYAGVRVLRFYVVYRAMVRAKIAAMRAAQAGVDDAERSVLLEKCRAHLRLAHDAAAGAHPVLVIHHGLSGSGKTSCSQVVLEALGAVRIRSDVERKRLHALEPCASSGSGLGTGLYGAEATRETYARLLELAQDILVAGYPVLVDATFLKRGQRDAFRELAQRLDVPFRIAHFDAPPETLAARIVRRMAQGGDASEASLEVLDAQLLALEPLAGDEKAVTVRFDTERLGGPEIAALARQLAPA